jgi:hypothetical protein
VASKTAAELVVALPEDQTFAVSKFQVGYTRWIAEGHGLKTGLGGSVGVSVIPGSLEPFYGSRVGAEFSVFLTVRPH